MNKEMVNMTNEEMFSALMIRMDSMELGLNIRMDGLDSRMDSLDSRMDSLDSRMDCLDSRMDSLKTRTDKIDMRLDHLEADVDMEFKAVRTEMDVVYHSLRQDIAAVNDKIDRLMFIKDVDGYEKMKIQVDVLTQGYQTLKEKIG